MVDRSHLLLLYRADPSYIDMEPVRDRLRYKINVTQIVISRQLDRARAGGSAIRTAADLHAEVDILHKLMRETDGVEENARAAPDPLRPPAHVAGFEMLANSIESYAELFKRDHFFDESFLRAQSSPPPPLLPKQYQSNQLLRQLERAEPGRVADLIEKHGTRYLPGFRSNNFTKPTKTPLSELDYVEMRARFILGRETEKPTLQIYNQITGLGVTKNNAPVYLLDPLDHTKRVRTRIPDFFSVGHIIGDVKNVREQNNDDQMQDNFRISNALHVRLGPMLAGVKGGRELDPNLATDLTPRFDLIVRVPWHPRGATKLDPSLVSAITGKRNGSDIFELIDDPAKDDT
jgi:hypothetical protein